MTTIPINGPEEKRIYQLADDGYVKLRIINGARFWTLTEAGWRCLAACAERPLKRQISAPFKRGD